MLRAASAIILTLFLALTAQANSPSGDSVAPGNCVAQKIQNLFFTEIERHPKSAELLRLRSKTIADYFPESETVVIDGSGRTIRRAKYKSDDIKRFKSDWDRLLNLRQDFGYDSRLIREGLTAKYSTPYPPVTPSIVENIYRGNQGRPLSLVEIQDQFLIEYLDYKYLQHGDFKGWRRYLSSASPYSLTTVGIRFAKAAWDKTKFYFLAGLGISLSTPLNKPFIDLYTEGVNKLKEKALDQLPERKLLVEALNKSSQLTKEAEALDLKKLSGKSERLQQWISLERRFKASHQSIHELRTKIKIKSGATEQSEILSPIQLQAIRQTFLTVLSQLAKDKSALAVTTKTQALANLKALELMDTGSGTEGLEKKTMDQLVDQLAGDPVAFQAFVSEYVKAQDLNTARSP